jgi:hypothetical protein
MIRFTNNPWIIRPALIGEKLSVDRHVLVNDFEAVGHAVAQAGAEYFEHLTGPDEPLPAEGTISVIGPGTGLGVAHIWRGGGHYRVQATEGGHVDFAPLDSIEDAILARLRKRHRRVSTERIVSGPGIVDIYETLASLEGRAITPLDDREIWSRGMAGRGQPGGGGDRPLLPLARQRRGRPCARAGGERRRHCRRPRPAHPRQPAPIGLSRTIYRKGAVREFHVGAAGQADHPSAAGPVRRRGRLCAPARLRKYRCSIGRDEIGSKLAFLKDSAPVSARPVLGIIACNRHCRRRICAGGDEPLRDRGDAPRRLRRADDPVASRIYARR